MEASGGDEPAFTAADRDRDRQERLRRMREGTELHTVLASFGEQPALMRTLGLVIDVLVPADVLDRAATPLRIRVRAAGGSGSDARTDRSIPTAATVDAVSGFAVQTDDGSQPGFADFRRYSVAQLDYEGGLVRALDLEYERQRHGRRGASPIPAARTTGFRLLESHAAENFVRRSAIANTLRVGYDLNLDGVLHADEIVRGYRLDVQDVASGLWHTLHGRKITYEYNGTPVLPEIEDEGWFSPSYVEQPHHQAISGGPTIAVSDAVVTWEGWGLAAPRPGKIVSADIRDGVPQTGGRSSSAIRADTTGTAGFAIRSSVSPGTLPVLRFGRDYRFRVRTVDLAGNALTLDEADAAIDDDTVSARQIRFLRYEPVPPPVPEKLLEDRTDSRRFGEHERRLVVRTGIDDGDDTFGEHPDVDERLLFPPKAAVQLAEWHGAFDEAMRADASPEVITSAYLRAKRESKTLTPGIYQTPWLADPASAGVCLHDVPGAEPTVPVTLAWPMTSDGPGPVRLRVVAERSDADRPPEVDAIGHRITIYVPYGRRATIRMSSIALDADVFALPALWRKKWKHSATRDDIEKRLRAHAHPMVTPWTAMELVHATQRPVRTPVAVGEATLRERQRNDTAVAFRLPWSVHGPTTGAVELTATWEMPTGLARASSDGWEPEVVTTSAPVGVPTRLPAYAAVDTEVTVLDAVDDLAGVAAPSGGIAAGQAAIASEWARVDLGVTARTCLDVRAVATSSFGEFFPPEYGPAPRGEDGSPPPRESRLSVCSEPVSVPVPNTGRPPLPDVTDALPLIVLDEMAPDDYEDETPPDDRGGAPLLIYRSIVQTFRREGGWLRVWLKPPWFASGVGERLSVVLRSEGQPDQPGTATPGYSVSTMAAADPAHPVASPMFDGMRPHHVDAPHGRTSARLTELADADTGGDRSEWEIADYEVRWDPARGQWYADLRIDLPGLYFPFVRLALARHQPESTTQGRPPDWQISPVVALGPLQILPTRTFRLATTGSGLVVLLEGQSYAATYRSIQPDKELDAPPGPGVPADAVVRLAAIAAKTWGAEDGSVMTTRGPAPSTVDVTLQRRSRKAGDDLLAWEDVASTELAYFDHVLFGHVYGDERRIVEADILHVGAEFTYGGSEPPGEYRLLVTEYEIHVAVPFSEMNADWQSRRVTFAQVVPLTGPIDVSGWRRL